jgi:hypothetical protein
MVNFVGKEFEIWENGTQSTERCRQGADGRHPAITPNDGSSAKNKE